ncbi:hypothetical protein JOE38_002953 [Clavibacter michiganensis]|uniref:hypothetical protein n=1 Tax=Clavibacter michiganensis TaxID=28447 RepID=UPI00195A2BD2|nr:hypothetical protein [Clavibacter michiganensis]MBM7413130.1 hypothetical protein [Clavibacter michiganensis]
MDLPTMQRVALYLENAVESDALDTATQLLMRGQYLKDSGDSPTFKSGAVLAHFQCIERISTFFPGVEAPDGDDRRVAIVNKLRDDLQTKTKLHKQMESIRTARNALERLDNRFADMKIRNAGKALGLGADWIDEAVKLTQFRNQRLGHGGTLASDEELEYWLNSSTGLEGRSFEVAAHMVAALTHFLWQKRQADAEKVVAEIH